MGATMDMMLDMANNDNAVEKVVEAPEVSEDADLVPQAEEEEVSQEEVPEGEPVPAQELEEWEIGGEKIQVDLKNKDEIKKVFEERHQLKGVQQEVMRLQRLMENSKKEFEEKHAKKIGAWDKVEQAWALGGVDSVLEALLGEQAAMEYKDSLRQRFDLIAQMSPEEKALHDRQEALEKRERAHKFEENRRKAEAEAREREKEAIFQEKFDAITQPAFFKYAVKGQLGDARKEEVLNKSIWNHAMERVQSEVIDKGAELTPAVIDGIFKEVAELFQGVLKQSGTKEAEKVINEKKQVAQTKVAATVSKRAPSSGNIDEIVKSSNGAGDILKRMLGIG